MTTASTFRSYASLLKLSHTVFALPFALAAVVLAAPFTEVTWHKLVLIVLCIAAARTAAMAFNRLVDRAYDAANPRTARRELATGALSVVSVRALVAVSCALFVGAAALLGTLPLLLSPLALALVLGYSYTKRFTWACHLILGVAVAFAPGGAWIAVGGPLDQSAAPWLLVLGVATWIAGFDILYALQDRDFDIGARLHSIPRRFGIRGGLLLSALLHVVTVASLVAVGVILERGSVYMLGVALIALLLVAEHAMVKPGDLSKLNRAFFDMNGYVSLAFFVCVGLDHYL